MAASEAADGAFLHRFKRVSKKSFDASDPEAGASDLARSKEYVRQQCLWAAKLVEDLAQADNATDKLNPAVLNSCNALAFINSSKGGLGISVASGYGFVIKKLSQDQYGHSAWGQPIFFTVSQAGFGVTAGYQHSQSVIAVLATGALDVFTKGTKSLGTDLGQFSTDGALTGMNGAAAGNGGVHLGMTVDHDRSAFCYSKVDGLYLELALHGSSVSPDHETNTSLYGSDSDVSQVLNDNQGKFAQDLKPLVTVINQLGMKAMQG